MSFATKKKEEVGFTDIVQSIKNTLQTLNNGDDTLP